jgi:hypothetical protein
LRAVLTSRVSGRLTGPEGTVGLQALRLIPVTHTEYLFSHDGIEAATALTDRTGAFTFLGVPPGQYVLRGNKLPSRGRGGRGSAPAEPVFWLVESVAVGNQDVTISPTWREAFTVSGRLVFDGASPPPPQARQAQIPILVESVDQRTIPGTVNQRESALDAAGTFTTLPIPAGRYLVRVGGAPAGWALRSVMYEGQDISDTAVDLKGPTTGVVLTFTDRITSLSGVVRSAQGAGDPTATVMVFTADPAGWQDFGLNPRRLKFARPDASGAFVIRGLPAGDYFVVAIPEEDSDNWRSPERRTALSRLATQVRLSEGDTKTQDLRTVVVR